MGLGITLKTFVSPLQQLAQGGLHQVERFSTMAEKHVQACRNSHKRWTSWTSWTFVLHNPFENSTFFKVISWCFILIFGLSISNHQRNVSNTSKNIKDYLIPSPNLRPAMWHQPWSCGCENNNSAVLCRRERSCPWKIEISDFKTIVRDCTFTDPMFRTQTYEQFVAKKMLILHWRQKRYQWRCPRKACNGHRKPKRMFPKTNCFAGFMFFGEDHAHHIVICTVYSFIYICVCKTLHMYRYWKDTYIYIYI